MKSTATQKKSPGQMLLVWLMLLSLSSTSQSSSFSDYLRKTVHAYQTGPYSDLGLQLSHLDYRLPLLEKVELRPFTDRLTLARQQFTLRASFNTIRERKSLLQKQQAYLRLQDQDTRAMAREKILGAYLRYVRLWRLNAESALLEKENNLLVRKSELTEKILTAGQSTDLSDYLELRTLILAGAAALGEKKEEFTNLASYMGLDTTLSAEIPTIGPEEISMVIATLQPDTTFLHETAGKRAQIDYLDASYRAEKAASAKILDFVQARYTVREDLLPENRFSVGIGLVFPYNGSTKLDLADIVTKQKIAARDISDIIKRTKEEFDDARSEFEQKLALHNMLKTIPQDKKYNQLKTRILDSGRLDPLKQNDILMDELNIESKTLEAHADLTELYIRLLHLSGKLYDKPMKNYLAKGIPFLD